MSKTTEESRRGQLMNFLGSEKHLLNICQEHSGGHVTVYIQDYIHE